MHGFESNCVEYDIRNEQDKIRMRSDCVMHCMNKIDNDISNFTITSDLLRRDILKSFGNISIKLSKSMNFNEMREKCLENCKPECNPK